MAKYAQHTQINYIWFGYVHEFGLWFFSSVDICFFSSFLSVLSFLFVVWHLLRIENVDLISDIKSLSQQS